MHSNFGVNWMRCQITIWANALYLKTDLANQEKPAVSAQKLYCKTASFTVQQGGRIVIIYRGRACRRSEPLVGDGVLIPRPPAPFSIEL
jgi:hypothetical protein